MLRFLRRLLRRKPVDPADEDLRRRADEAERDRVSERLTEHEANTMRRDDLNLH